jgi:hypothetical protein
VVRYSISFLISLNPEFIPAVRGTFLSAILVMVEFQTLKREATAKAALQGILQVGALISFSLNPRFFVAQLAP